MDERKMDPEMKLNAGLNEEPVQEEGVQEEGPEREGLSLEESFVRLDEMIEKLQDQDTSLEEAFRVYQEGMALVKSCSGKIDLVEKKVMVLNEEGEMDEL